MKIKIAFYSHNIDFAGTWRGHERTAEKIQLDERFETYVLYTSAVDNNRLEVAKKVLYNCNFLHFERSKEKLGPQAGYTPINTNFEDVIRENGIEILHFARSGYYEWPFNKRMCRSQIETNIFGYRDPTLYLDGTISVARCLGLHDYKNTVLIPSPIPLPSHQFEDVQDLREELGINKTTLVFGRIGRPANFSPIALEAFNKFRKHVPSKYIIVGACNEAQAFIRNYNMQDDVIMIECTNDDHFIERFHKTIDIFAHYRSDGEICSTAISQALMYGIPAITHYAGLNGQAEWIGPGGACVSDHSMYLQAMLQISDPNIRKAVGLRAKEYAMKTFEQEAVVKEIADFYISIYRNCQQVK